MFKRGFIFILILSVLSACTGASPAAGPASTPTIKFELAPAATVTLPTAAPPPQATPTSTSVMEHLHTPTPVPTATKIPRQVRGLVSGVLDAERIVMVLAGDSLQKTYVIRLLGVEMPPTEAWRIVTAETLDKWLTGKIARIAQDTTMMNEQDELPRYLYLSDELINLKLIELGLARANFKSPDTKLKAKFESAEETAKSAEIGLWGPDPTPTPTISLTPGLTATITLSATQSVTVTQTPVVTATRVISN